MEDLDWCPTFHLGSIVKKEEEDRFELDPNLSFYLNLTTKLPSVPQTTNFTFGGKKKKKNVCAKFELD
jgi:hypothetical protein